MSVYMYALYICMYYMYDVPSVQQRFGPQVGVIRVICIYTMYTYIYISVYKYVYIYIYRYTNICVYI